MDDEALMQVEDRIHRAATDAMAEGDWESGDEATVIVAQENAKGGIRIVGRQFANKSGPLDLAEIGEAERELIAQILEDMEQGQTITWPRIFIQANNPETEKRVTTAVNEALKETEGKE